MKDLLIQKPLNVSETAVYTGLKPSYLYKLIHLKRIPYYKPLGGRVFFKQDDLEAFIFRGKQSADYELAERAEQFLLNRPRGRK